MATLHAPFNFVPLNEKVYSPDWADKISQDVPFSDGVSGVLDLVIKAESPIFIRNGAKQDKDDKQPGKIYEFSHTEDGRYFIPATSIKGAIRSVLEIISFGKMTQVQNQSFGIRDLSNGEDGKFYREKITKNGAVHCGWMWKDGNKFYIDDCGAPDRISAERLATKFSKSNMWNFITDKNKLRKDENRTAKSKYKLFEGYDLHDTFSEDDDLNEKKNMTLGGRHFVKFGHDFGGTIVFTGQSSARESYNKKLKDGTFKQSWKGKVFEFVFRDNVEKHQILIPDYIFNSFESIHRNSPDYKDFRRKELYSGKRIPVFFIYDEDQKFIDSIGLSYMYKYPAYNSVFNGILKTLQKGENKDLAECIFGYTDKEDSLKGRVQFTTAFLEGEPKVMKEQAIALSTPHPSYYPLYLGGGQTWNTDTSTLAGRKRYPIRNTIESNSGTEGMTFSIKPLDKGSTFVGKIFFHNLRPIELGALLKSINLWDDDTYYHSLGQGKPLGYGKVKMHAKLSKQSRIETPESIDYTENFQNAIKAEIQGWNETSVIQELKALMKGIPAGKDKEFLYMDMDANEFKHGKECYAQGEQLGYFTQILSGNVKRVKLNGNVSVTKRRAEIDEMQKKKVLDETISKIEKCISQKKFIEAEKIISQYNGISSNPKTQQLIQKIEEAKNSESNLVQEAKKLIAEKQYENAIK